MRKELDKDLETKENYMKGKPLLEIPIFWTDADNILNRIILNAPLHWRNG